MKTTSARQTDASVALLQSGVVERVLSGTIEVSLGDQTRHARRAKSCLVAPVAGDTVLCASSSAGVFVLAVLESQADATRISAEGDVEISAGGRVTVCGREGVAVASAATVDIAAAETRVTSRKGLFSVEDLTFLGRLARVDVTKLAFAAESVDQAFTRLTQRAKRIFRFVEEVDQTRAGTVDLRAQNLLGLRGENAVISARVLAKIDGEQIHVG